MIINSSPLKLSKAKRKITTSLIVFIYLFSLLPFSPIILNSEAQEIEENLIELSDNSDSDNLEVSTTHDDQNFDVKIEESKIEEPVSEIKVSEETSLSILENNFQEETTKVETSQENESLLTEGVDLNTELKDSTTNSAQNIKAEDIVEANYFKTPQTLTKIPQTPAEIENIEMTAVSPYLDIAKFENNTFYKVYPEPRLMKETPLGLEELPEKWNLFYQDPLSHLWPENSKNGYSYQINPDPSKTLNSNLANEDTPMLQVEAGDLEVGEKTYSPQTPDFKRSFGKTSNITKLKNIYPQIDIRFEDSGWYRKKEIHINEVPSDLKEGQKVIFTERLTLPVGAKLQRQNGEEIESKASFAGEMLFIDFGEGQKIAISPAIYFDSANSSPEEIDLYGELAVIEVSKKDNEVEIKTILPANYLLAKEREYPVVVDPVYFSCNDVALSPVLGCLSADTYIRAEDAGFDDGISTWRSDSIFAGLFYDQGHAYTRHGILNFDLDFTSISGSIDSAGLVMYYDNLGFGTDTNTEIAARRITSSWPSVSNQSDYLYSSFRNNLITENDTYNVDAFDTDRWIHFDISDSVMAWQSGSANHGLLLESDPPAWPSGTTPPAQWEDRLLRFSSSRAAGNQKPYLWINTISASGEPDYEITNLNLPAGSTVQSGDFLSVQTEVTNNSNVDSAQSSSVKYYLSTDQQVDASDYEFSSFTGLTPILANQSLQRSISLPVPTSLPSGAYYLIAVVDPNNTLSEANESNNQTLTSVEITGGATNSLPDLTHFWFDLSPLNVAIGDKVTSQTQIQNQGTGDAPISSVYYYMTDEFYRPTIDLYKIREGSFWGLLAGEISNVREINHTIEPSRIPGTFSYYYWLDAEETIEEESEINNTKYQIFTIEPPAEGLPDLIAVAQSIDLTSVEVGGDLDVGVRIQNIGTTWVDNTRFGYYLSTDTTWDASDYLIEDGPVHDLDSAEYREYTDGITLPNWILPGDYYILVIPDHLEEQAEGSEANNQNGYFEIQVFLAGEVDTDGDGILDIEELFDGTADSYLESILYSEDFAWFYNTSFDVDFDFPSGPNNNTTSQNAMASSALQSASPAVADPVNARTGAFDLTLPAVEVPGRGAAINFQANYSSKRASKNSRLGNGWTHSYHSYYYQDPTTKNVQVYMGGAYVSQFITSDGGQTFTPYSGQSDSFSFNNGIPEYKSLSGTRYVFSNTLTDNMGALEKIIDPNGNETILSYLSNPDYPNMTQRLVNVYDPSGRDIGIMYDWDGEFNFYVQRVRYDYGSALVWVNYEYDADWNLINISSSREYDGISDLIEYSFTYDNKGLMTSKTDPDGTILYLDYDSEGRVIEQREFNPKSDAPQTSRLLYEFNYVEGADPNAPDSAQCTIVKSYRFASAGPDVEKHCFNEAGQKIYKSDSEGFTESWTFDSSGMIESYIDQTGALYEYDYDGQRRLSYEKFPEVDFKQTEIFYSYEDNFNRLTEKLERVTNLSSGEVLERSYSYGVDPANGNIIWKEDPSGATESFAYNTEGNLIEHSDKEGNVTTNIYDSRKNNLIRSEKYVTNVLGQSELIVDRFYYDYYGNLTRYFDPNAENTYFEYDNHGNLRKIIDPEANEYLFDYDLEGRLAKEVDPLGRTTLYQFDGSLHGFLLKKEQLAAGASEGDPNNIVSTNRFDQLGNLIATTDPKGFEANYQNDGRGLLTQLSNAFGTQNFEYDGKGNLVRETNSDGQKTEYFYDQRGRQIEQRSFFNQSGASNYLSTSVKYDGFNRPIEFVDSAGESSFISYDLRDLPVETEDQLGNKNKYFYDQKGRLIGELFPRAISDYRHRNNSGHSVSYIYDQLDRLIKTVNAHQKESLNFYDPNGNLTKFIDRQDAGGTRSDHQTTFSYDSLNRLIGKTNSLSAIETYQYDTASQLLSFTDSESREFTFSYDHFGRLISESDAGNFSREYEYDQNGNLLKATFPDNSSSTFEYDSLNRVIKSIDQLGNFEAFNYDIRGNLISKTDKNGGQTNFSYDLLNRLISEENALGYQTNYGYDIKGNLVLENVEGKSTSYEYDSLGRLTKLINPGGDFESFEYDYNGNVRAVTDSKGQRINLIRDSLGRLVKKSYPSGEFTEFSYDNWDNILSVDDPETSAIFTYDSESRKLSENRSFTGLTGHNFEVINAYNSAGQLSSRRDAAGRQINYEYDNRGLLDKVIYNGQVLADYNYNSLSQPQRISFGNQSSQTYSYDKVGRLAATSVNAPAAFGRIKYFSHRYGYDPAGNKTSLSETFNSGVNQTLNFEYDPLHQLTKVIDPNASSTGIISKYDLLTLAEADNSLITFEYDQWGNRTKLSSDNSYVSYSYKSDSNQLLGYLINGEAGVRYTYDQNGSQEKEKPWVGKNSSVSVDSENIYSWNEEGELASVKNQKIDDGDGYSRYLNEIRIGELLKNNSINFSYDENGNRIKKRVGGKTKFYFNNGLRVLNEIDGNGVVTKSIVYGLDRVAEIYEDGSIKYQHQGGLGSLVLETNQSGEVENEYQYDPFGELTGLSKEQLTDPDNISLFNSGMGGSKVGITEEGNSSFLFTGQEWDGETGLHYYNARYYNPVTGRFISRDSYLGSAGNQLSKNRYIYVENNPLKYVDPSGNVAADASAVLVACDDFGNCQDVLAVPLPAPTPTSTQKNNNDFFNFVSSVHRTLNPVVYNVIESQSTVDTTPSYNLSHGITMNPSQINESNYSDYQQYYDGNTLVLIQTEAVTNTYGMDDYFNDLMALGGQAAQEYFDSKSTPSNSGTNTGRSSGQTINYGGGTSGIMSPSPTYPAPIPIPSYDLLGKINIKDPARLLAEVNRLIDSVDYLTCLNGTALFSGGGGDGKTSYSISKKVRSQMKKRGWTENEIKEALKTKGIPTSGKKGKATRYEHPKSGKSLLIDNLTKEIFHVGGSGFLY